LSRRDLEERTRSVWRAARYASVGLEFGISVVVGYFVGHWLEEKFGFAPWGAVGGVCLGFAAGVRTLVQAAKQAERDAERDG
jgi:F0F1-type ATP synthase assembly protein I